MEHYRTHEQRHNHERNVTSLSPNIAAHICIYMCMHMSASKKQTPICDKGVASFNKIHKDKDIKLYPVAP